VYTVFQKKVVKNTGHLGHRNKLVINDSPQKLSFLHCTLIVIDKLDIGREL